MSWRVRVLCSFRACPTIFRIWMCVQLWFVDVQAWVIDLRSFSTNPPNDEMTPPSASDIAAKLQRGLPLATAAAAAYGTSPIHRHHLITHVHRL